MIFICKSSYDDYNKDKDSCIVKMCQCVGIMVAEKSISEKILLEKTHSLNVTPVLSICTAPLWAFPLVGCGGQRGGQILACGRQTLHS